MSQTLSLRLKAASLLKRSRPLDLCISLLLILATIGWALLAGKDLNFDQLNYHFYIAHSLVHDRLHHDFMAANGQSYLNPLAYVPFYLMVMNDWHSMLISATLAGLHGLNIVFAYFITKAVVPEDQGHARAIALFGAALAFLSPVFLAEAGTTFADAPTSALVLGAVLVALRGDQASAWWKDRSMIAGLLMGIAGALKLSNLVFGPACALLLLVMEPTLRRQLSAMVLLGVGSIVGFAVTHGYWGWQLWKTLGNPLFPLFGAYFPTDSFPTEGATLERFLPETVWDSLLLPFRMMQSRSWIYIESISPDLRFAGVVLIALIGGLLLFFRRRSQSGGVIDGRRRQRLALCLFFVSAYGLWQWSSGNGRYGLVLSILCGPLLALVTHSLFRRRIVTMLILGTLTILQVVHLQSGELRWTHGPWTRSWYEVSVPERLKREPFLYISIGNNSNSYIYPYLAAGSAFTNPLGQIAFDLHGPGGRQLQALLAKHEGRIRMFAAAPSPAGKDDISLRAWTTANDSHISRLGYAIDESNCELILATGPMAQGGQDFKPTDPNIRRMRTCRLVPRPFTLAQERARMTKVAEEVVRWCPKLFKPAYTVVERSVDAWSASYPSTDSMLIIKDGMIYGVFVRATANLQLGTVENWEQGKRPLCDSFPDRPRKTYTFD